MNIAALRTRLGAHQSLGRRLAIGGALQGQAGSWLTGGSNTASQHAAKMNSRVASKRTTLPHCTPSAPPAKSYPTSAACHFPATC